MPGTIHGFVAQLVGGSQTGSGGSTGPLHQVQPLGKVTMVGLSGLKKGTSGSAFRPRSHGLPKG